MEDQQPPPETPRTRKQYTPRDPADDLNKVRLTDDGKAALRKLRQLWEFSGEDEAKVMSKHFVAELENRIAKLKKGAEV